MSNNIKILIVEDEQMLAEILSDTLSDRNFDVRLAYDGIQALEAVRKESFDVIVSDIMMPTLTATLWQRSSGQKDIIRQYCSSQHVQRQRMWSKDSRPEATTSLRNRLPSMNS